MVSYDYEHSIETTATADAIWALYEDVATWPQWDGDAESVTRDGPFVAGTAGTMKFRGQDPFPYTLATVRPKREFVDEVRLGDMVVRASHRLEPLEDGGTRVTHAVRVDGPAEQAEQVGRTITADFPVTMSALVALAEERAR